MPSTVPLQFPTASSSSIPTCSPDAKCTSPAKATRCVRTPGMEMIELVEKALKRTSSVTASHTNHDCDITGVLHRGGKITTVDYFKKIYSVIGSKNSCIDFPGPTKDHQSSSPTLRWTDPRGSTARRVKSTHPFVRVLEQNLFSNDRADVTGHVSVARRPRRADKLCCVFFSHAHAQGSISAAPQLEDKQGCILSCLVGRRRRARVKRANKERSALLSHTVSAPS